MTKKMSVLPSSEGNVWKYIFTDENVVLEAVLYQYNTFEERTVICCSVQSGCPVGCTFCGTGKNFLKNISSEEIIEQVQTIFKDKNINTKKVKKLQIMFMSMGEPMLNWNNVKEAIKELNKLYPNADLLLSTIGVKDDIVFEEIKNLSKSIDKVGLQFSIHKSTDEERDILIPYSKKYNLKEISIKAKEWKEATGRQVYFNYCIDEDNSKNSDIKNLKELFKPEFANFTFSVICEADETMKEIACLNKNIIKDFEKSFLLDGYNTRIFDPAGQDDIGGGCGQLWYVQEYLNKKKG